MNKLLKTTKIRAVKAVTDVAQRSAVYPFEEFITYPPLNYIEKKQM